MKIHFTALLLIFLLTSCTPTTQIELTVTAPNPTSTLMATQSPIADIPTATFQSPTATVTPQPTITPSPIPPTPTATRIPRQPITIENANRLQLIFQLGNNSGRDVTWANDGKLFAISTTNTVDFYNPDTLEISRSISTPYTPSGIMFSIDQSKILVIDQKLPGQAFDISTGQPVEGYQDSAFCENGEVLAVYRWWNTKVFCVPETMKDISEDPNVRGAITLAIAPHGSFVLIGGQSGFGLFRTNSNGKLENIWETAKFANEWGTAGAFSPDGKTIVAGFSSGKTFLIDIESGEPVQSFQPGSFIEGLSFHPDGSRLVYVSRAGVGIISLSGNFTIQQIGNFSPGEVESLALSPNGDLIAFANRAGDYYLWDTHANKVIYHYQGKTYDSLLKGWGCFFSNGRVTFSNDGRYLALGENGLVNIIDLRTLKIINSLDVGSVSAIAFSPDGEKIAIGKVLIEKGQVNLEDGVIVLDIKTGSQIQTFKGVEYFRSNEYKTMNCTHDLAFLENGQVLAVAGTNQIRFWNLNDGQPVWTSFDSKIGGIWAMAVSNKQDLIGATGYQSNFKLWPIKEGKIASFPSSVWPINSADFEFSKDDKSIISVNLIDENWSLLVHDLTTGKVIYSSSFATFNDQLTGYDIALSQDGTMVAVVASGIIMLYGVE